MSTWKNLNKVLFVLVALACACKSSGTLGPKASAPVPSVALQALGASLATPTYLNWNSAFNAVADEQKVEPGSKAWNAAGMNAYSGSTGGQPSYGWKHDHKVNADYVRAVLANYGHRRIFYDNAPVRLSGYLGGGRPIDWKLKSPPEDPGDQASGEVSYLTSAGIVMVSGPDTQHAQFGPLFAVADSKGFMVKAKGKDYDASLIARIMIRYHLKALRGHFMKTPTTINPYLFGDRGCSTIVNAAVMAIERGAIDPEDQEWFSKYVIENIIPFYEKAPGHHTNTKDNGLPLPNFQTYNGLLWLIPPFHKASKIATGDVKLRLEAIVKRLCQWYVDLDEIVPEYGGNISAFAATDEIVKGINGLPLPSLKGKLTKEQILGGGGSPMDLWGFTAGMIAEEVLGAPGKPLADKLRAKWLPKAKDPDVKSWLVGANGEYVISMETVSMRSWPLAA